MQWSYKSQTILAVVLILLANILTDVFRHWIYRSAGFVLCGLLWIFHPVAPAGMEETKDALRWIRIAGIILIFIGIFTRVHHS